MLIGSVTAGGVLAFLPGVTGQQTAIIAELTTLPTLVAALEVVRRGNRRPVHPT